MLDFNRVPLTRFSILITTGTIFFGPLYSETHYSWVTNTISQLGAQSTKNNWIMVVGFLSLGIGLVMDTIRFRAKRMIPFGFFGLFFALAGCFPHQAWIEGRTSSESVHLVHQIMANLSGVAITIGHIIIGVTADTKKEKMVSFFLASTCIVLPLAMFTFSDYTGVIQRVMYGASFVWLWKKGFQLYFKF